MRQVTAYQTRDGELFLEPEMAEARERNLDFNEWYEDNKLYFGDGENEFVDTTDVKDWLDISEDAILKYLGLKT